MENSEKIEIKVENTEWEKDDFCENSYKCPQCPKMLKNRDCLTKHVRNVHSETRIECNQ